MFVHTLSTRALLSTLQLKRGYMFNKSPILQNSSDGSYYVAMAEELSARLNTTFKNFENHSLKSYALANNSAQRAIGKLFINDFMRAEFVGTAQNSYELAYIASSPDVARFSVSLQIPTTTGQMRLLSHIDNETYFLSDLNPKEEWGDMIEEYMESTNFHPEVISTFGSFVRECAKYQWVS